jgi:hypothetical protein
MTVWLLINFNVAPQDGIWGTRLSAVLSAQRLCVKRKTVLGPSPRIAEAWRDGILRCVEWSHCEELEVTNDR